MKTVVYLITLLNLVAVNETNAGAVNTDVNNISTDSFEQDAERLMKNLTEEHKLSDNVINSVTSVNNSLISGDEDSYNNGSTLLMRNSNSEIYTTSTPSSNVTTTDMPFQAAEVDVKVLVKDKFSTGSIAIVFLIILLSVSVVGLLLAFVLFFLRRARTRRAGHDPARRHPFNILDLLCYDALYRAP